MVQEYIKGKNYWQILSDRKYTFSEIEIVEWLKSLLPILTYIHGCNVIHRDISPDNILQAEKDRKKVPILIDFGVVKQTLTELSLREQDNPKTSYVGKVGYSPTPSRSASSPSSSPVRTGWTNNSSSPSSGSTRTGWSQ